jgi:hypothetical protein
MPPYIDLKGVSPDIGLHFRFWKIKLVLSAGTLMVLTFSYVVIPEIFKNWKFICFDENTYLLWRPYQKPFQNLCSSLLTML